MSRINTYYVVEFRYGSVGRWYTLPPFGPIPRTLRHAMQELGPFVAIKKQTRTYTQARIVQYGARKLPHVVRVYDTEKGRLA